MTLCNYAVEYQLSDLIVVLTTPLSQLTAELVSWHARGFDSLTLLDYHVHFVPGLRTIQ